jgi:nitrite reductase/ring-hydroxylating ferredoxin subunit/predicted small lipoprotein YifL
MARHFDRRWLLARGCAAVSLSGSAAAMALSACAEKGPLVYPDATGDTSDPEGSSPPTDTYPCHQPITPGGAGWTELPLAEYPDLEAVGGWYPVTAGGTEIVVAHIEEGCYTAILRACAHEGVAIDYVPARGQFVCPQHGAIYDEDGEKVGGPAPTGLPVYPCGREGDSVWVRI